MKNKFIRKDNYHEIDMRKWFEHYYNFVPTVNELEEWGKTDPGGLLFLAILANKSKEKTITRRENVLVEGKR